MRITLEPTVTKKMFSVELTNPKVVIEVDSDDLTIDDTISLVLRPALLGWGFGETTLNEVFGEE